MNDVLEININGIRGLLEFYHKPRKNYMSRKDFLNLFTKDSDVMIGEKEAIYCYGMSKMTVIKESVTPKLFDKVELSEFCEMICRVADAKYKSNTTLEIAQKIEKVLEELFVCTGY